MRLLVDANLSPGLIGSLAAAGHDAVHVGDVGLLRATDAEILAWSEAEQRVIVTADTDFPMMVALRGASGPSVVLMRGITELTVDAHAELLTSRIAGVADDIARGAIITITPLRIRVRDLPIR